MSDFKELEGKILTSINKNTDIDENDDGGEMEVNERELENEYPIHQGYLYIVDGEVWKSDRTTNVSTLRITHKFKSIKNCAIKERNLWHLMS